MPARMQRALCNHLFETKHWDEMWEPKVTFFLYNNRKTLPIYELGISSWATLLGMCDAQLVDVVLACPDATIDTTGAPLTPTACPPPARTPRPAYFPPPSRAPPHPSRAPRAVRPCLRAQV